MGSRSDLSVVAGLREPSCKGRLSSPAGFLLIRPYFDGVSNHVFSSEGDRERPGVFAAAARHRGRPVPPGLLRWTLHAAADAAGGLLALTYGLPVMEPLLVVGLPATRQQPNYHVGCYPLPPIGTTTEAPSEGLNELLEVVVPELVIATGALTAVLALHAPAADLAADTPDGIYVLPELDQLPGFAGRLLPDVLPDAAPQREYLYLLGSDGTSVGAARADVVRESGRWRHAGEFVYLFGDVFVGDFVPTSLREAVRYAQLFRAHN